MRGYAAIGLYNAKKELNVGGAMRAAACYGASLIVVTGNRLRKYSSDTTKTYRHTPLIETDNLLTCAPYDCIPVAVELTKDAKLINNYVHPERAYYIFGPEDGSIPNEVLTKCKDVIYIPTKYCMNLAATVNVVLYDRMLKNFQKTTLTTHCA